MTLENLVRMPSGGIFRSEGKNVTTTDINNTKDYFVTPD